MMAIRTVFVATLALAGASAWARDEPRAAELQWKIHLLPAGELHEECLSLQAADRLIYAFVAQDRLDFNIHFTRAEVMHFLVKKSGVRRAEAVFRPVLARDYCMMWSNPGERALEFRYRFSVRPG
jgi:hypothetical protein